MVYNLHHFLIFINFFIQIFSYNQLCFITNFNLYIKTSFHFMQLKYIFLLINLRMNLILNQPIILQKYILIWIIVIFKPNLKFLILALYWIFPKSFDVLILICKSIHYLKFVSNENILLINRNWFKSERYLYCLIRL